MDTILHPLEVVVSWVMIAFHAVFSPVFGASSGVTWSLSIVGLVVVIRVLLIPLFVKQIKAQRGLQLLQPEIKKLQDKYKGDRERQSQELMKLYKETGTNPLASCLPILVQMPIFYALFRVLQGIAHNPPLARGALTHTLAAQASHAHFFGAKLADTFRTTDATSTRVVTVVMIVAMSLSQFITQRQLMVKNVSAEAAAANPMAQQQKMLLYVMPVMFAVFGINFPIGVLIYWLTTNVWSMGQQFYVIRNMPSPGTPAEKAYQARMAAKQAHREHHGGKPAFVVWLSTLFGKGTPEPGTSPAGTAVAPRTPGGSPGGTGGPAGGAGHPGAAAPDGSGAPRASGQRQQPVRKDRARRSPNKSKPGPR